jgi:hypothetical protein
MGLRVGCATVPSKTEGAAREPSASLAALLLLTARDRRSLRSLNPSQPYENVKGGLLACSTSLG